MTAPFQTGDLVLLPARPEYGPGKVALMLPDYVYVFFRDLPGRKANKFRLEGTRLERAAIQSDAILDNLPPFTRDGDDVVLEDERLTPKQTIAAFLDRFPGGFSDPAYLANERDYKWEAHRLCTELLSPSELRRLVEHGELAQVAQRIMRVVSKVNLIFSMSSAALHDALELPEAAQRFALALADLIEAPADERALQSYLQACKALPQTGATSPFQWPVVTLLPFLARPDVHLALKPTETKEGARRLGFALNYDATPNLDTYRALLRFGATWFEVIAALQPRDMIDVQSFVYVTSGGYDKVR